jgi:hypothetical protein
MLQQQVTSSPGPHLDESRSLQLADHLRPGHAAIVKPNARLCQGCRQANPDRLGVRFRFAGEPDIAEKLKNGHTIDKKTFKVHLDG